MNTPKLSLFKGIFFGVFGLAAVIGLFVFATRGSKTASNNDTVGTVVIWGTLPKAGMQNALTKIIQTQPSLKDVSYAEKDEATLATDLSAAIATGNPPDLVLVSQEDLLSIMRFLTPIPLSTLSENTFTSSFIGEGRLLTVPGGGGYYGIPFLVDPLVLYANQSILSSNGVAKPPATWESLAGLVPSIAIISNTHQVSRGLIGLGTYANVMNARAILSALFFQTNVPISAYANGSLVANLSGTLTDTSSSGRAVLGFYTQFADPSKVSYTWNSSLPDSRQAFLTGDAALYLGFASESASLTASNPNLDFLVTPIPQPATATTKRTYGLLYSFLIPHNAGNASGAFQTAALLTSSAQEAIASDMTGLAPASLTSLGTAPSDPAMAVAYTEALYADGWLSPAPPSTDGVFSDMITNVITGRSDLTTALATGEQALSALLQK